MTGSKAADRRVLGALDELWLISLDDLLLAYGAASSALWSPSDRIAVRHELMLRHVSHEAAQIRFRR